MALNPQFIELRSFQFFLKNKEKFSIVMCSLYCVIFCFFRLILSVLPETVITLYFFRKVGETAKNKTLE